MKQQRPFLARLGNRPLLLLIGLAVFVALWGGVRSTDTGRRLSTRLERGLVDFYFSLRSRNLVDLATGRAENPYLSDQVLFVGIDEESLGQLGRWPWHRDVHARFLASVQRFSPRAVYFDIAFVLPETMPASVARQLAAEPDKLWALEAAFAAMDQRFAAELARYDNVYLDLFLVEEYRPGVPYLDRIRRVEEEMERFSLERQGNSPFVFRSLEPVVDDFLPHVRPVTVQQYDDEDDVFRSWMLLHPYETEAGKKRYLLSAALALLLHHYGIDDLERVAVEEGRVVLRGALVPELGAGHKQLVRTMELAEVQRRLVGGGPGGEYNRDLFLFLKHELEGEKKQAMPPFPLSLLEHGNGTLELLAGREILDAAAAAGVPSLRVVISKKRDLVIRTERNDQRAPGSFPINFAGPEKVFYADPDSGEERVFQTVPSRGYSSFLRFEELPPLAALDGAAEGDPDLAWQLVQWYSSWCDRARESALALCVREYGEITEETIRKLLASRYQEGKVIYFAAYLEDILPLMEQGELERPLTVGGAFAFYPQWLAAMGLEKTEGPGPRVEDLSRALFAEYAAGFGAFYHRFLFTGAQSAGMAHDIKNTPYGAMYGPNVVANAFNTVATNNQLLRSSARLDLLLLLGFCLLAPLVYGVLAARLNFAFFLLLFACLFFLSYQLFAQGNFLLRTMELAAANLVLFLAVAVFRVLTEERDKQFFRETFAQYVSPELIDAMYENRQRPALGGRSDVLTAYFTDIASFSTFSEYLTAEQLVELLNEYLSAMTDILLDEQGTLDKYEGDAIIAFFGAPYRFEDHALRACRAALRMQQNLVGLRGRWQREKGAADRNRKGLPAYRWQPGDRWPKVVHRMRMRIGINTGEIVTGNMGSATRKNYTMMGDAVNLAARLEAAAKQYGVGILVSEAVYGHEFTDQDGSRRRVAEFVEARFLDTVTVVGKSEPVRIYELVAMKGELSQRQQELLDFFTAGMEHYLAQRWADAEELFARALLLEEYADFGLTPSLVFAERCRKFAVKPPVEAGLEWDGVHRLTSK